MKRAIRVAVMGAGGYGAAEVLRLCAQHPAVEVAALTSSSRAGRPLHEVHPHLRGFYDLPITEAIDFERLLDAEHTLVFSTLPHGVSGVAIDQLLSERERAGSADRVRVVDLSGDLRLTNVETHQRFFTG